MAVAVQSSSSTAWASSATVVITKPTGVVVGDLLIAQIGYTSDGTFTITPPAGWTTIQQTNIGVEMAIEVFYKVATSTETAASDFTFTCNNTTFVAGGMMRIDGQSATTPIWTSAEGTVTNSAAPSFTNTITPAVANSLILMFPGAWDSNNSAIATYAIATSNPSWTELWDLDTASNSGQSISAAWALRPQTTATGNSSCAGGDANTDWACIMVAIPEIKTFTISDTTTVTEVSVLFGIGLLVTETINLVEVTAEAVFDAVKNVAKNISTWINQDKS